jgi:hypothetical protein
MGRDGFGLVGIAILFAGVSSTIAPAVSLAMEIRQSNDGSEIHLSGKVEAGDFEKFEAAAATAKNARVSLTSPGGRVDEALLIGESIHKRGLSTIVPDGAICSSACGFIWLAGGSRFVEGSGRVGFHAVYLADSKSISGSGNARVGAYMARLGFSDLAIVYATEAGPSDMRWLIPSNASFLGISVTWSNISEKARPGLSTALSRTQIEDALLRQRLVQLLRAKRPGNYNMLVDEIVAAQAQGRNWANSLIYVFTSGWASGAETPAEADHWQKLMAAAAANLYASEQLDLLYVRPRRLLQNENFELCAEFDITNSKVIDALLRGDSLETEKWRSGIVRLWSNVIESALSDPPPVFHQVSAAERKLLERWLERQEQKFVTTLSKREINFIRMNKKAGPRVLCKHDIFVSAQLRDNQKMGNIFLRDAYAEEHGWSLAGEGQR